MAPRRPRAVPGDLRESHRGGRAGGTFVDYGFDGASPGDTLRGFRRHEQVHPLAEPGLVDLTVDADFGACARHGASAARACSGPRRRASPWFVAR